MPRVCASYSSGLLPFNQWPRSGLGGTIVWKTEVVTAAIMRYSNRGSFTMGFALITHSMRQARREAQHVLFFRCGKLIEQGTTNLVLSRPTQAEARQFLEFYGV